MKNFFKRNLFPIIVISLSILLWGGVFAFDIFDLPSKMGLNIARFNFEIWSVLASITSGALTFLGVLCTIKNGKEERNEDRKRLETDRKEEEKRRAKPYLAVAGKNSSIDLRYSVKLIISKSPAGYENNRGKIAVINNVVCVLTGMVIGNVPKTPEHTIAIGNNQIGSIHFTEELSGECYLIGEDIYGNRYKYPIKSTDPKKTMITEVGMPIEIVEE